MDEQRQKKILMMRIGVGLVVFLIAFFWIINLKNVWRTNSLKSENFKSADWSAVKARFDSAMTDMRGRLAELDQASSTNTKLAERRLAGGQLVASLIEETENLASSSASSTIAASSSPDLKASTSPAINCPEYIDCMPTIGRERPCVVPNGCAGITKIAY